MSTLCESSVWLPFVRVQEVVFVCACKRGWKSYDMWQLVGWCQWGRMERRGKGLLPQQHRAGVADGRVAWCSCQLRQWKLWRNNTNDSVLLLWLWTTGLRKYTLHQRDVWAISDDNKRLLHFFNTHKPFSFHPLLRPRSLKTAIAPEGFWLQTKGLLPWSRRRRCCCCSCRVG